MPILYPPTGTFPSDPGTLERSALETLYLDLRHNYRGLMVSRGQFRGQAQRNQEAMH